MLLQTYLQRLANRLREEEQGLEHKCPYCREPVAKSQEEGDKNSMKRVKANDPIALLTVGVKCQEEGDYEKAFEYYTNAAGLGDFEAHYNLSLMYHKGEGVEKDLKKEMYHLEEAAIGGHRDARFNLGNHEGLRGNYVKAMKHKLIAAKLGDDDALEQMKKLMETGLLVSK